jgi:hypothetical protein
MAKPILLSNNLAQQQQYYTFFTNKDGLYIVGAGMMIIFVGRVIRKGRLFYSIDHKKRSM